jgi:hypothetical protein
LQNEIIEECKSSLTTGIAQYEKLENQIKSIGETANEQNEIIERCKSTLELNVPRKLLKNWKKKVFY